MGMDWRHCRIPLAAVGVVPLACAVFFLQGDFRNILVFVGWLASVVVLRLIGAVIGANADPRRDTRRDSH